MTEPHPPAPAPPPEGSAVLHRWTARRLSPLVLLGVALVFLAFMALSFLVFHSVSGVKALAAAAFAALVPLVPAVLGRIEYRLTDAGLERRPVARRETREFTEVFRWEDLERIVPGRRGFVFHERPSGMRRPDRGRSGQVLAEAEDRVAVLELLAARGVSGAEPGIGLRRSVSWGTLAGRGEPPADRRGKLGRDR